MNNLKGFFSALTSGVTFGLIPLFTLPIMAAGLGYSSIIFYRFLLAALVLGVIVIAQKKSLRIRRGDILPLFILSLFYDGSTYFLIWGYDYLASGIATSVMFLYTVFVVVIMIIVFKEQKTVSMLLSVILAVAGVVMLSIGEGGQSASFFGVFLVLLAAFSYALYIVMVNNSALKYMDDFKLTFYVMLFGGLLFLAGSLLTGHAQRLQGAGSVTNMILLAVVATVIPNVTLVYGIKNIGSIIASILGALSPVTAVFVGMFVFGEALTEDILAGLLLVFLAVFVIMFARPIDGKLKGLLNRLLAHLGLKIQ